MSSRSNKDKEKDRDSNVSDSEETHEYTGHPVAEAVVSSVMYQSEPTLQGLMQRFMYPRSTTEQPATWQSPTSKTCPGEPLYLCKKKGRKGLGKLETRYPLSQAIKDGYNKKMYYRTIDHLIRFRGLERQSPGSKVGNVAAIYHVLPDFKNAVGWVEKKVFYYNEKVTDEEGNPVKGKNGKFKTKKRYITIKVPVWASDELKKKEKQLNDSIQDD